VVDPVVASGASKESSTIRGQICEFGASSVPLLRAEATKSDLHAGDTYDMALIKVSGGFLPAMSSVCRMRTSSLRDRLRFRSAGEPFADVAWREEPAAFSYGRTGCLVPDEWIFTARWATFLLVSWYHSVHDW
jgi:hypothetical protein